MQYQALACDTEFSGSCRDGKERKRPRERARDSFAHETTTSHKVGLLVVTTRGKSQLSREPQLANVEREQCAIDVVPASSRGRFGPSLHQSETVVRKIWEKTKDKMRTSTDRRRAREIFWCNLAVILQRDVDPIQSAFIDSGPHLL